MTIEAEGSGAGTCEVGAIGATGAGSLQLTARTIETSDATVSSDAGRHLGCVLIGSSS
jgi:hypothetical protein